MQYQRDSKDCSLVVAQYFIELIHGQKVPLDELKINAIYQNNGISLESLKRLINQYSLSIEVFNCDLDTLKKLSSDQFPFATIINQNNNQHMIIIEKCTNSQIWYIDPAYGKGKISLEEFQKIFLNIIVAFSSLNQPNTDQKEQIKNFTHEKVNFNAIKMQIMHFLSKLLELFVILLIPLMTKYIFSEIIPYNLEIYLYFCAGFVLWILITQQTFKYLTNKWTLTKVTEYSNQQKLDLLKNLKSQYSKEITKLNSSEFLNRIIAIDTIWDYKSSFLSSIIVNGLYLIIGGLMIYTINFVLLYALIIYCLINFLISLFMQNWYNDSYKKILEQNIALTSNIEEYYNYVNSINISQIQNKLYKNIQKQFSNMQENYLKTNYVSESVFSISSIIEMLGPFVVLFLGSFQIWKGAITLVDLIFTLTAASLLTKSTQNFWPLFNLHIKYKTAKILLRFFKQKQEIIVQTQQNQFNNIRKIELSYVDYQYEQNYSALNVQRLVIDQNTHLKGMNGIGKTTLFAILSGNLKPSNGIIKINNIQKDIFNDFDLKNNIIYIGHKNNLSQSFVSEYVNFSNINEFSQELSNDLINKISTLQNKRFNELSSGEIQVVNFLKIIEHPYLLYLFDEAFDNLSESFFNEIKNYLNKKLDNSLVIETSHNNKFIFDNAKEVHLEKNHVSI
ncbi:MULTISPECIES: Mbov_0121 family peptidase domain-containing ABC transporter [unclassified Mycoplasma]|uniref:Mbov_0121 family peptidase domain-containing ABC transporter n=1 Tax=unclassified Mycoplasma TaxID=2683645 RepID=UPI00211C8EC7|nr:MULTISPECIES: cysteine peptidase family C39 domain-containing protein [unclassified Mycoplasma]UUM19985.1 cysteine peptidase family C39 domain-containing protein [Mycoplasma sp. 1578d]UUM24966.1 cysteine peptidase family C39 domain-containing protein [Mycoplasma sp. 3686d]